MLLHTLGASLLGNALALKKVNRADYGSKDLQSNNGKKIIRLCKLWIQIVFLIPPYLSTNFEILRYYQNQPKFSGINSRDNQPNKIKDEEYVINLDEYSDIGTHSIALYPFNSNVKTSRKKFKNLQIFLEYFTSIKFNNF